MGLDTDAIVVPAPKAADVFNDQYSVVLSADKVASTVPREPVEKA